MADADEEWIASYEPSQAFPSAGTQGQQRHGKGKSRRQGGGGGGEGDEEDGTFIEPGRRRREPGATPEEIGRLAGNVVRFLLVQDRQKRPLGRAAVVDACLVDWKRDTATVLAVMETAKRKLQSTFGMTIAELVRSSGSGESANKQRSFILVNQLPQALRQDLVDMEPCEAEYGLIAVIYGIIATSGASVVEQKLMESLSLLGVSGGGQDQPPHPVFGDVAKLIRRLVSCQYLAKTTTTDKTTVYSIGERGRVEMDLRDVLRFVTRTRGHARVSRDAMRQFEEDMGLEGSGDDEDEADEMPTQATQMSQTQMSQTQMSQTQMSQTQVSQTQMSQTQQSQTQPHASGHDETKTYTRASRRRR